MQGASKAGNTYRAGDTVPETGVYTVIHDRHRPEHSATLFKGETFPTCLRCGPEVRFVLARPAALLTEDMDFTQASEPPRKS